MVGFPAKPIKTVEEVRALEAVVDQDPKVKTFKDTLDFPSIDSFLDFDSVNWLGSNRNIEEFSIEDTDFDFFMDKDMEIGQEEKPEFNQAMVKSESSQGKPDIRGKFGVSSIKFESMVEAKPVLCEVMSDEVGVSSIKSELMTGVDSKLCDDISAKFDGGDIPVVKESEPGSSDNSRPMEGGTGNEAVLKESEAVNSDNSRPIEGETEPVVVSDVSVACPTMDLDESELKKTDEGLACSIEVGLKKVSLAMDGDKKSVGDTGKNDSAESESETSSSSASSSDSSSSSEEEDSDEESEEEESKKENKFDDQMVMAKEEDVTGELEEGEIEGVDDENKNEVEDDDDEDDDSDDDEVNEMIAWSNDEDDDLGLQTKEPIRSKNELKELPPVPAVDVTLEPHHATLPVGAVLSVMSTQVIVEGKEQHSPLTEGSILWITERRIPLGLVDEIFGPVKCPYYIVRFNSESDVPEGITQGTPVSFVADFAQHILNIKELQKKGYDASGDNDEEISEELEFSDDEKEAEYRKMQKMEKQGMINEQKSGNTRNKKKKNRDLGRPTNSYSGEWTENKGASSLPSKLSVPQIGGPVANLHSHPETDGFSPNNAAWRLQGNQQNPYQLPPEPNQVGMPNLASLQLPLMAMQNQNQMMFQPQFNGGQMPIPGGPGGLNFFPGQAPAPWPALVGQNCFNQQPFRMGCGIQQQPSPNELNFNLFAPQGFQMHRPQSPMNPQFQMQPQFQNRTQSPMNPQYQLMHPPQSPMNPQFQMQPQSDIRPQLQIPQSPNNPQSPIQPESQGFSSEHSSERVRRHRGRGRGRGRGWGRFGRGRGHGRQESG